MNRTLLAALATGTFLVTLILHAPAALLLRPSPQAKAQWAGPQGTLASGRVEAVLVNNRPAVRDLRWELQPLWLALLRVTFDVEAGGDGAFRGRISRAPFGTLRLSGVEGTGSVKSVLTALGQPALPIDGEARLALADLRLDAGIPVKAQGTAELFGVRWGAAREPIPIGDFSATLETDDRGVLATLASGPGPLELSGDARVNQDRTWEVRIQMRPRPDAGQVLRAWVQSLGAPDAQGWSHFRREGRFAEPKAATPEG